MFERAIPGARRDPRIVDAVRLVFHGRPRARQAWWTAPHCWTAAAYGSQRRQNGIERPEDRIAQGKTARGDADAARHGGGRRIARVEDRRWRNRPGTVRSEARTRGLLADDESCRPSICSSALALRFSRERIDMTARRRLRHGVVRVNGPALAGGCRSSPRQSGHAILHELRHASCPRRVLVDIGGPQWLGPQRSLREILQMTRPDVQFEATTGRDRGSMLPPCGCRVSSIFPHRARRRATALVGADTAPWADRGRLIGLADRQCTGGDRSWRSRDRRRNGSARPRDLIWMPPPCLRLAQEQRDSAWPRASTRAPRVPARGRGNIPPLRTGHSMTIGATASS